MTTPQAGAAQPGATRASAPQAGTSARRSLRERLHLRHAIAGGGMRGFLSWWGRALLSWLPRRWRLALGMERGRLLLQPEAGGLELRIEDGDGLRDLARLPAFERDAQAGAALATLLTPSSHDLPRWLLLPAGVALRRRLVLPAAAGERLRDVVGFEIDRQTPFAADEVAFDARALGRREGDGQIEAELVVVPRQSLQAAEAVLGDLSGQLAGIDVLGADGAPLGINLLAPAQRRRQADPMRRWNLVLAAVALVAGAAMLWQVLHNRRAAADAFEQVAAERARAARGVSLQRQQLVDMVEGQAFLDRTRAGRPTAVEVLDELTRRLPDSTYLEKLAIEGDRITLIGRSSEAAALPGRLEGAKLWRAPALAGALQPDPRSGRDIFTLTAELVKPKAPAPGRQGDGQDNAQDDAPDGAPGNQQEARRAAGD